MSDPEKFDMDDLDQNVPPDAAQAICELLLVWPRLESAISTLLVQMIGLPPDEAIIFLGEMGARMKLERIRDLFTHRQITDKAAFISEFMVLHQEASATRNLLSHAWCVGVLKSERSSVVFMPFKIFKKGMRDQFLIQSVPLTKIVTSTLFASEFTTLFEGLSREIQQG